jgi:hypothetical protein
MCHPLPLHRLVLRFARVLNYSNQGPMHSIQFWSSENIHPVINAPDSGGYARWCYAVAWCGAPGAPHSSNRDMRSLRFCTTHLRIEPIRFISYWHVPDTGAACISGLLNVCVGSENVQKSRLGYISTWKLRDDWTRYCHLLSTWFLPVSLLDMRASFIIL